MARTMASAGLAFSGKRNKKPADNIYKNMTAIVSSQPRFNEVLQLVRFANPPLVIKGRIAIGPRDAESSIGKLNDISHLVERKMFNHLIFSEGDISFKECIALIESLKKKVVFLFHAKKSRSIVGSSKKNEKGIFIAEG
jgi:hypothetical protein